ncbi:protein AF-10-like isoform X2 [Ornithodoros turicata]|uniref:protein AF-10-like isoform X2 n=1 Tax=Ornithodoros turicata TaxID=34597 RepID=UPI003139A2FC
MQWQIVPAGAESHGGVATALTTTSVLGVLSCYGIVQVPTGPWFCRKCESQERCARVRCELCPSKDGALKRTDNGGWAHVVCALYIPEVRFGNVTTMEPIVLQLVPQDRFSKTCFICEQQQNDGKASIGACMQCNKSGCKQYFHVTCAQAAGLLCEEAGNYMDNVKYCGYCPYHYQKLKRDSNIKIIPAFKPIPADFDSQESSPDTKRPPAKARMKADRRGPKCLPPITNGVASDDPEPKNGTDGSGSPSASSTAPTPQGKFTTANFTETVVAPAGSPVFASTERQRKRGRGSNSGCNIKGTKVEPASPPLTPTSTTPNSNPTPTFSSMYENLVGKELKESGKGGRASSLSSERGPPAVEKRPKVRKSGSSSGPPGFNKVKGTSAPGEGAEAKSKRARVRKKSSAPPVLSPSQPPPPAGGGTEPPPELVLGTDETSRQQESMDSTSRAMHMDPDSDEATLDGTQQEREEEKEEKVHCPAEGSSQQPWAPVITSTSSHVLPPKTAAIQQSPVSAPTATTVTEQNNGTPPFPQTLEQLLERQWEQGSTFLMKQAQHFDIASLLSCLHQLRAENQELESRINGLVARRDHLLAVNARLVAPLRPCFSPHENISASGDHHAPAILENGIASGHRTTSPMLPLEKPGFHTGSPSSSHSPIAAAAANIRTSQGLSSFLNMPGAGGQDSAQSQTAAAEHRSDSSSSPTAMLNGVACLPYEFHENNRIPSQSNGLSQQATAPAVANFYDSSHNSKQTTPAVAAQSSANHCTSPGSGRSDGHSRSQHQGSSKR